MNTCTCKFWVHWAYSFDPTFAEIFFSQDAPYDKRPAMDGAILLQFAFAVLATTAYSVPKKLTEKRRLSAKLFGRTQSFGWYCSHLLKTYK